MRVIIIGAGLAGLSVAWYLREGGAEVTVLERQAGPGLECSFANGALLHPSMAEPWNAPGVLGQLLRNLGRSESHMLLRLAALPSLFGWGIRFIRASRADRYLANTRKNILLARYSVGLMEGLRSRADLQYGAYSRGSLQVFRNDRVAESTLAWGRQLAAYGLEYRSLSVAELVAQEPALAPISNALVGGIHMPHDQAGDAYRYCCAMTAQLQARGVEIHYSVCCRALSLDTNRVAVVADTSGRSWPTDTVVLAAGSYSPLLANGVGLALPIRPVKGYSITAPRIADAVAPRIPVVDPVLHVATVPLGEDQLRVAGTAEFTGYNLDINPKRVENIIGLLRQLYPEYLQRLTAAQIVPWAGLRPMCADGVPLLGPTPIRNLFLNTGHGHLGWTLAAGSARLVADLVLVRRPDIDPAPYALERFTGRSSAR
jgi:D-amino-acid dehydrogenase